MAMSDAERLVNFLKNNSNGSTWVKIEFSDEKPKFKGVVHPDKKNYFTPSEIKSVVDKL